MASKVKNDQQENVRKLAEAHDVSTKQFTPLFIRFSGIKEAGHADDLIGLLGDEEGVSQNVQGFCNDKHRCSMTILDDVLTFGELAEEEQTG
jgi:hypothetical protein